MKKILALPFTILIAAALYAQPFEGIIIYQNTYKSKLPSLTDEKFNSTLGTRQEYRIKGGSYKSAYNGSFVEWQLYNNSDNKLYTKMSNSETALWNDGSIYTDSVLKVEVNKGVIKVLDYSCDEVILTCKYGIQKYYFNSKLGVDISLYDKHVYGNWYEFLKVSKALPLKSVIDKIQFTLESIAIDVKAMKLEDKDFKLPENIPTFKSPY